MVVAHDGKGILQEVYIFEHFVAKLGVPAHLPPLAFVERPRLPQDGVRNAYLAHVEQYPRGHATLLRGGIGSDPEVRAIVDDHRRVNAQRILDAVAEAGGELTPAVRLAVRGWIGFVEAVTLEWVERREVSRDEVRTLLVQTLGWSVGSAAGTTGLV